MWDVDGEERVAKCLSSMQIYQNNFFKNLSWWHKGSSCSRVSAGKKSFRISVMYYHLNLDWGSIAAFILRDFTYSENGMVSSQRICIWNEDFRLRHSTVKSFKLSSEYQRLSGEEGQSWHNWKHKKSSRLNFSCFMYSE